MKPELVAERHTELYRRSVSSENAFRTLCERSESWMATHPAALLGNRAQEIEKAAVVPFIYALF